MTTILKIALIGLLIVLFARAGTIEGKNIWQKALAILTSVACFTATVYLFFIWIIPMLIEVVE